MGSKHNPPRWWRPTLEEECNRWDALRAVRQHMERTFLSRSEFGWKPADAWHIEIPKDPPQITWVSWEEVGAPCRTLEGQDITPNMTVGIGMEIAVPTLFGYARATITSDSRAEDEYNVYPLTHDPIRGLVCSAALNKKAIMKIQLVDIDHAPRKLDT